jgi:NAD+--asparagine ADP-ribosyltransferase
MSEERPIVFTITDLGNKNYKIITKDPRGEDYNKVCTQALFYSIRTTTEELNNKGYAVLFEVD